MGNLHVQVSLYGCVVEDRVVPVRGSVVVGDWPGAAVGFPGASVQICRAGSRLRVLGRSLAEDESTSLSLAHIHVVMTHTKPRRHLRSYAPQLDHRFFATAVVMVLMGGWIDAAEKWVDRTPPGVQWSAPVIVQQFIDAAKTAQSGQVAASVQPTTFRGQGEAPPSNQLFDGPRHESDDHNTGTNYTDWYRAAIPADIQAEQANQRLTGSPGDIESRRIVARHAYHLGQHELAEWHYRTILEDNPEDVGTALRLGWSLRRQGRHSEELAMYRTILSEQPGHLLALCGEATALARLGRFQNAQDTLDALQVMAPTGPVTELAVGTVEAIRGNENRSLSSLRVTMETRERLTSEMQIELRRDIAHDPAFDTLRAGYRMRSMLRSVLGVSAPRSVAKDTL